MNYPTVAVIVPAYNEEQRIRQCLYGLIYQTVPADEILVVDNRSTDETRAIVEQVIAEFPESPIRYLQQFDEQGLIPTRNYGFNSTQCDVLGRIDADSIPEPGWIEELKRIFSNPLIAGATGPMIYYDMPLRRFGLRADNSVRKMISKLNRKYQLLFGSNMALSRTAWQKIEPHVCLDKEDVLHEDIDLSVHLANANLPVVYSPKMICGMSARRLEDSPRDYRFYVQRFQRTYDSHGVKSKTLKLPIWIFLSIYFPLRLVRKFSKKSRATGFRQSNFEKLR